MSGAVDTKAVEMRFDNSNFEKNASQSISTLEKLKRALKLDGASAGLREVEKASKKLEFRELKDNIDGVGKKFSALEVIATGALLRIGSKAADIGMKVISSMTVDQVASGWDKYAQKVESVQTIMANLREEGVSFNNETAKMEYVNGYLEKLIWFSDETSYSFSEMTSNLGKFIAVGQGLEDSVTAIEGIATWAAMAGQRSAGAARAMYNISQALGVGAMTTIDWKSIENANMATAEFKETAIEAAVALGKLEKGQVTIESFRESLQKKWFDKDVMMAVFKQYGAAADKIQEYAVEHNTNVQEAIRNLKKEDAKFAETLGFRAFAAAQEAKTFGEVVEATADAVSSKWIRIFENIFGNYQEAKELWTDFSEQLWEVFAQPLDTLNEIMNLWKQGFLTDGPQNAIEEWFESTNIGTLANAMHWVADEAGNLVEVGKELEKFPAYRIKQLADGTKQLVTYERTSTGVIISHYSKLVSGRELLLEGFQNIFDTFIHDVEDENGQLESMSFFGSFKRALQEVVFGTSEVDELIPLVARKLFDLTMKFRNFTASLKPSMETSLKLKNAFKGLFTLFKIGGKFVKAIIKPFKDLFAQVFKKKEGEKGLLGLADSMGTWIQKLDEFLDKNNVFQTVTEKISSGIDKIRTALDNVSMTLTGMSLGDYVKKLKDDIFGFFENYDFSGTWKKVSGFFTNIYNTFRNGLDDISLLITGMNLEDLWNKVLSYLENYDYASIFTNIGEFFSGVVEQFRQLRTGELPEKLTPLQSFYLGLQGIFTAMRKFFSWIAPAFKWIGDFISNVFTTISEAFSKKETKEAVEEASPIWEGMQKVFSGLVDFFTKIGPTLGKIGEWIGNFFSSLGDTIATWAKDKTPDEIIGQILKGGFLIALTDLVRTISGLGKGAGKIGTGIAKDLKAVKGVLKAYAREINASALIELAIAVGIFAGAMWVIAQIPTDKMDQAKDALFTIFIALSAFSLIKQKLSGAGKAIKDAADGKNGLIEGLKDLMTATVGSSVFANDATAKFVKIALGIFLAAIAAKKLVEAVSLAGDAIVKLAEIPETQLAQGGRIVAQIITLFAVFALFSGLSRNATSGTFAAIGAYILVLALSKLIDVLAALGSDSEKMDNIQKVVDKFQYVFAAIKQAAEWAIKIAVVLAVIEVVMSAFAAGKGTNTLAISMVLKQFGKNFLRIAAALVIIAVAMGIMASVAKNTDANNFNAISGFFIAFYSIVGGIQAVAVGLASYAKDNKETANILKQFGKNFVRIAASLLIVAAAFWAMSKITFKNASFTQIAIAFGVFLAVVGLMTGLAVKVASMKKSEYFVKNLKAIANMFIAVALSLAIVAGAFAIMANLPFKEGEMNQIGTLFAGVALAVGIFALIAIKNASAKKSEYIRKNIESIAGLFIAVALSLVVVASAFAIMSALDFSNGPSMWSIAGVFGAFIVLVGVLSLLAAKLGKAEGFIKGVEAIGGLMMAVAVSLVIVSAAFAIMASLSLDASQMWNIAGVFGAFIGIVALLSLLAMLAGSMMKDSSALKGFAAIAGLLLATAVSLVIVAKAFSAMSEMSPEDMEQATEVMKKFGILVGILALVGGILGAIPGGALGMAALAGIILAIGAACLMAGAGISRAADAFAHLVEVVADKGPEFAKNIKMVIEAFLDAIISLAPKIALAGAMLIASLALGILTALPIAMAAVIVTVVSSIAAALEALKQGIPTVVYGLIDVINTLANTIRAAAPLMVKAFQSLIESLIEYVLVGLAGLVEPFGGIGKKISEKITKWIPALRDAFGVVEDVTTEAQKDIESGMSATELEAKYGADYYTWATNTSDAAAAGKKNGEEDAKAYAEGYKAAAEEEMSVEDIYASVMGGSEGASSSSGAMSFLGGGAGTLGKGMDWKSMLGSMPGVEGGVGNFTEMLGITSIDMTSLGSMFSDGFAGIDFESMSTGGIDELVAGFTSEESSKKVTNASGSVATDVKEPIETVKSNATTWGNDIDTNLANGMIAGASTVKSAAEYVAGVIRAILGFSEPEEGPLSDFHTYAPDMIALWNKGIYNNLGSIETSTTAVADTMYDGFSTALDYVSDLIDNGMSDQLTIRPVMDLTEIQNGVDSMNGLLGSDRSYMVTGTSRLAASAAYGIGTANSLANEPQVVSTNVGSTNNTFYISNSDPDAVADRVSKILANQTRRQKAVWGHR